MIHLMEINHIKAEAPFNTALSTYLSILAKTPDNTGNKRPAEWGAAGVINVAY